MASAVYGFWFASLRTVEAVQEQVSTKEPFSELIYGCAHESFFESHVGSKLWELS